MKMQAAVLHSTPAQLCVEEIEIAAPGIGEVRVKIAASGLCHTDWETMHGYQPINLPAVIGHEGAGVVEAVGPGVSLVAEGDHVACSWSPNCGHCFYCDHGQPILCDKARQANSAGVLFDGTTRMSIAGEPVYYYSLVSSHAEYCIVPEQAAIPLRRDFPLDRAALLGCAVMTGYGGAVRAGGIQPEDSVVVVGCGAVGLNAVQGARIAGASVIVGLDLNPLKLEWASQMGATHTLDASTGDALELVHSLTLGRGADVVIEAAGHNSSIRQALEVSRPGARVVILGKTPFGEEVSFPFHLMMGERRILRTSYGMSRPRVDFPRLANLYMDGRLHLDQMISQRLPLARINDGFDDLEKGNVARSLIIFDD
ncbi:MAG: zinc-binding dehydrogenase [Candidatus Latescibacteria bacterium]|nr:zinc-binding dehydrogenase [Candidatus Latescibacterota bacterium]